MLALSAVVLPVNGNRANILYINSFVPISLTWDTGKVDATGFVVDFAGPKGMVILSAEAEINLKLNTARFDSALPAWTVAA